MKTDLEYRGQMDLPMEDLTLELFGAGDDMVDLEDWQIVERAAAKIRMLKLMLVTTGMSENLLKIYMEN